MMKKLLKSALIVAAMTGLSACAMPFDVSRDASITNISPVIATPTQDWSIVEVRIDVPRSLTVSEANSIRPFADIVWREDPMGDRYEQVEALMTEALAPVLRPRDAASTPVIVSLEVMQFHALTERARYTTGGAHEIVFMLTVADARTGRVLSGPRPVDLTFRAAGGQAALAEEAQGITQRVRVTERLQAWARAEFPMPAADLIAVAQAQN
ncbi:DUF6778 family protein [Roseicyclus marinus]|uniref:DUF6778 family protein n=1 Tax=Roseicyclus marinus TaxID=2161673 RepID=UPI00241031B1|nr:DUF6778 family protein [Roseicyclus marinus]MDG3042356.1 hypothetical protein [Roseicyclus marinus]